LDFYDASVAPGWFDYVGLGVSLIGFGVAIRQIYKTRGASEAATKALLSAQKSLISNTLLSVVTQFQLVVADLDQAMSSNHGDMAHRALVRYGHLARETRSLLDEKSREYDDLKTRLWDSSEVALDVKEKIVQAKSPDIGRLAKQISREINTVSLEMTEVVANLRHQVGGSEHV